MINFIVKSNGGYLVKEKIDKRMMNLHSKTFMELDKDELQREIDYIWGVYDYVSQSEHLQEEIKTEQAQYLWGKIDAMTTRYLHLSMKSIRDSMESITEEMRGMRDNG